MGMVDRLAPGLEEPADPRPKEEYVKYKLPFVKTQYGVHDNTSGGVILCANRDQAHRTVESDPDRWTPMVRHVSEWLEDK
jgi:hypothetical protein